jgi:hypothetical protein
MECCAILLLGHAYTFGRSSYTFDRSSYTFDRSSYTFGRSSYTFDRSSYDLGRVLGLDKILCKLKKKAF